MRDLTCKVLEAMDNGILDARAVADMCLGWMNEDDMREMLRQNDVLEAVEPDDEEEFNDDEEMFEEFPDNAFDDGDALASAGWGTDEDYGSFGDDDFTRGDHDL